MQGLSIDQRHLRLHDGRLLAYRSVGPRDGTLVVYLHGAIGTPLRDCSALDAAVRDLGVHYVLVSRPGFGESDPSSGRTLLGFADDVAQLADHLGRERFAVVGASAGGPYALACARALPERVVAAALVSSMSPWSSPERAPGAPLALRLALRLLRSRPRPCSRTADALLAIARRHPEMVGRIMLAGAAPADRTLLRDRQARELAVARFLAAARGGIGQMLDDYLLCAGPWGFAPQDVRGEVHLWHGVLDQLVPVDEALHMAAALPRAQTALDPDEGHFIYGQRLREILTALVAAMPAPASAPATRSRENAARWNNPTSACGSTDGYGSRGSSRRAGSPPRR